MPDAKLVPPDVNRSAVQCGMEWHLADKVYEAQCSLPLIDQAGDWRVEVALKEAAAARAAELLES